MMTAVYQPSLITRRARRDHTAMAEIRRALYETLAADHPMTVRQLFYRLVSQGVIDKTENQYKNTVIRLLVAMRRSGEIPYSWLSDNTRWMRKPDTHSSMEQMLFQTARTYRRSVWDNQNAYCEVWLEKDALAGVIYEETAPWDVPLMVTRGYASLTYLAAAAEAIADVGKPAYLYYFGDHDPSGVDIPRKVEMTLRELAPGAEIHFERVAVQRDQIILWDLPTRPTKGSDSRSKGFEGESVEVDAIPPAQLRALVRSRIEQHIDPDAWETLRLIESEERDTLMQIARHMNGGAA